jgi:hypothetical protein
VDRSNLPADESLKLSNIGAYNATVMRNEISDNCIHEVWNRQVIKSHPRSSTQVAFPPTYPYVPLSETKMPEKMAKVGGVL